MTVFKLLVRVLLKHIRPALKATFKSISVFTLQSLWYITHSLSVWFHLQINSALQSYIFLAFSLILYVCKVTEGHAKSKKVNYKYRKIDVRLYRQRTVWFIQIYNVFICIYFMFRVLNRAVSASYLYTLTKLCAIMEEKLLMTASQIKRDFFC